MYASLYIQIPNQLSGSDEELFKSWNNVASSSSFKRSRRGKLHHTSDLGTLNIRLSNMDLSKAALLANNDGSHRLNNMQLAPAANSLVVESDSFTEAFNTPAKPCRKKRLIKRMAVDHSPPSE